MHPPAAPARHTTGSIAKAVGGSVIGRDDLPISDLAPLDQAGQGSLSFIRSGKFAAQWAGSKACAALVSRGVEVPGHDAAARALIEVDDADLAMVTVLTLFMPEPARPPVGVHPTTIIDPSARISPSARIGPFCSIGPRAVISDGDTLHMNVFVGADVQIGPGTELHSGVVVYERCLIGAMSILHSGVVIGADGFGYRPDPQGRGLMKIPHVGTVKVGNAVEIGANSCVDRGKFGATSIGDGTKIDNLVQIGHNCRVGRACVICGCSAIAGSVTIGDGAVLGGEVGVADNLTIGARAQIAARSGILHDIPPGEIWGGMPARPQMETLRAWAAIKRLGKSRGLKGTAGAH